MCVFNLLVGLHYKARILSDLDENNFKLIHHSQHKQVHDLILYLYYNCKL